MVKEFVEKYEKGRSILWNVLLIITGIFTK